MIEVMLAVAMQAAVCEEVQTSQHEVVANEITQAAQANLEEQVDTVAQEASDAMEMVDTELDAVETRSITVPAKHPILISIQSQLGSKISTAKDFFPIELAQAVVIDGVEVLPAGITGEGQVIHAEKAGFGGSAGELLLAARYLMHGERRIELRSFKFLEEGDELFHKGNDTSNAVIATTAALGPLGLLIGGSNTVIEPGTAATAKFRHEEIFEVANDEEASPLNDVEEGN